MKVGDLVKIKKGAYWRVNATLYAAIIVAIDNGPKNSGAGWPTRITIHSGERFFLRDLEVINET